MLIRIFRDSYHPGNPQHGRCPRQSRKEALGNAERVKRAGEFKEIGNVPSTAGSCLVKGPWPLLGGSSQDGPKWLITMVSKSPK